MANAVWIWGIARAAGGSVLLRIEDHDRGRSRPEYERAILEDLEWLGLAPDRGRPLRQSDHDAAYRRATLNLARRSQVYACRCSRADIARRLAADGAEEWDELRYPGTCRDLRLPLTESFGIRVVLGDATVSFDDRRLGPQSQSPSLQCGDVLLRDATGNWTYQHCVTVDDTRQGVTLVIRGEDLLASTGRQILLSGMLGRETAPAFLHHPLIMNPEGTKLGKRDQATGIRDLRAAGRRPDEVLGEAAWRTGLLPDMRPVEASELAALFK
ncbi:MAG: glutamate--tRNA ligase family protein [Chloroflexota bacterium]|nr:glutamate--tRNA ligase family protein [Chloroflexota bacterium]